ncbi:17664_t:CDS:1, partial [Acaulospora morrowiae]
PSLHSGQPTTSKANTTSCENGYYLYSSSDYYCIPNKSYDIPCTLTTYVVVAFA